MAESGSHMHGIETQQKKMTESGSQSTVPVIKDGHANLIIVTLPGRAAGCSFFLTSGVYIPMMYQHFLFFLEEN